MSIYRAISTGTLWIHIPNTPCLFGNHLLPP